MATNRGFIPIRKQLKGFLRPSQPHLSPGIHYFTNTSNPQKHEWVVILPDREGALELRRNLRPQHLANLSTYPNDFWLWGGPFLRKPSHETLNEPLGSMLLAWAESPDKVLDELKKDIYTKEGVWDWEKVQIYPFRSTLRNAMG